MTTRAADYEVAHLPVSGRRARGRRGKAPPVDPRARRQWAWSPRAGAVR